MTEETLCMKTRLERVALCADIASHYVQDMRVMPASGVARVAWDAMDHIDALEAKVREAALSELSALSQASEAYTAQLEAEAKLAKAVGTLRDVVDEYDRFRKDEYERGLSPLDDEMYDARATLAAIKGDEN
jgi:hypothetical protein